MDAIFLFCLFLPCAVCLVALVTIAAKLRHSAYDGLLIAAAALMSIYFFSYAYTDLGWVYYLGKTLGIIILPLIYLWARAISQSDESKTSWLLIRHFRDKDWSARDHFLIRADIAILAGVLVDLIRQVLDSLNVMPNILEGGLALAQAAALYIFFASAIYVEIIDNPAVNKDTFRAVQQARQRKLREDFEKLMSDEKPYLKQGITIEDVALMLATNRTYVSSMLHDDYGCTFPEYMTEKRLEYSKEFMVTHPHEVQEEIAFQCGFASASGFNKRFRETYGITPREWLKLELSKS